MVTWSLKCRDYPTLTCEYTLALIPIYRKVDLLESPPNEIDKLTLLSDHRLLPSGPDRGWRETRDFSFPGNFRISNSNMI